MTIATVSQIQDAVADHYGIEAAALRSPSRVSGLVRPRHLAMYLSCRRTGFSLQRIAKQFDRRDHTTILHAITSTERRLREDQTIEADAVAVLARLMTGREHHR